LHLLPAAYRTTRAPACTVLPAAFAVFCLRSFTGCSTYRSTCWIPRLPLLPGLPACLPAVALPLPPAAYLPACRRYLPFSANGLLPPPAAYSACGCCHLDTLPANRMRFVLPLDGCANTCLVTAVHRCVFCTCRGFSPQYKFCHVLPVIPAPATCLDAVCVPPAVWTVLVLPFHEQDLLRSTAAPYRLPAACWFCRLVVNCCLRFTLPAVLPPPCLVWFCMPLTARGFCAFCLPLVYCRLHLPAGLQCVSALRWMVFCLDWTPFWFRSANLPHCLPVLPAFSFAFTVLRLLPFTCCLLPFCTACLPPAFCRHRRRRGLLLPFCRSGL